MVTTGNNSSCGESRTTNAFPRPHKRDAVGENNLPGFRRARRPEIHRRRIHSKRSSEEAAADEKAEVERKILALQSIVPGGESLGVDKLFEETAGYILALQFQVKALRAITSFVEGSEKEKRKLGG